MSGLNGGGPSALPQPDDVWGRRAAVALAVATALLVVVCYLLGSWLGVAVNAATNVCACWIYRRLR